MFHYSLTHHLISFHNQQRKGKMAVFHICCVERVRLQQSLLVTAVDSTLTQGFKIVHRIPQPHPTQDLLTLCGLQPLAATVARSDPITGDKINKMRRSYEGQVKNLGLAGRNKAVKQEEGKSGGLMELMQWPDEEWQNQKIFGREIQKGLPTAILAKLEKAMKLEPGTIPKNDEWENVLGHEKLKTQPLIPEQKMKSSSQPQVNSKKPNGHLNGMSMIVGTPSAGEVVRPKRTGRKRRYDEHSFEGYGEGYVDDDGEILSGGGYSSGEGSRKSSVSKKKRKKVRQSLCLIIFNY